jgi:hypothetical protein
MLRIAEIMNIDYVSLFALILYTSTRTRYDISLLPFSLRRILSSLALDARVPSH